MRSIDQNGQNSSCEEIMASRLPGDSPLMSLTGREIRRPSIVRMMRATQAGMLAGSAEITKVDEAWDRGMVPCSPQSRVIWTSAE